MSYDRLRESVLEEFALFTPFFTWEEVERTSRYDLDWVMREPAPFSFTPKGFEAEAQRLEAEAVERDRQFVLRLERIAGRFRSWYSSISEARYQELLAYQRNYWGRPENREKKNAQSRARYEQNREQLLAKQRAKYKANKETIIARRRARRARRRARRAAQVTEVSP